MNLQVLQKPRCKITSVLEECVAQIVLITLLTFIMMPSSHAQGRIEGKFDPLQSRFVPDDPQYFVGSPVDGFAVVKQGEKFGIVDTSGNLKWPIDQEVMLFPIALLERGELPPTPLTTFGILLVADDGHLVGINSECTLGNGGTYFICTPSGELITPYLLIWAKSMDRFNMYKPNGLIHFMRYEFKPNDIGCIRCGYCYGYMGILNTKGELLVAPDRYRDIADFHNGRARVMLDNGKYGYIDEKGCEVIPCTFDQADNFLEGKATVTQGKKTFEIGIDGKRL
jgi:hypothetical protein